MNKPERSGMAAVGWVLTLAGLVAVGTLAFSILSTEYRRQRFLSLLQGDASVDGIGVEPWLLVGAPMLVIGLGIALIAVSRAPSPVRP